MCFCLIEEPPVETFLEKIELRALEKHEFEHEQKQKNFNFRHFQSIVKNLLLAENPMIFISRTLQQIESR